MPEEYFLQLVQPRVAPAARPWESGLPLENGRTAPFVVDRGWVGPAGTYIEEWSIRRGDKVLYRHPAAYIEVRGFQAVRRFTDTVRTPLALEPGDYDIVLVVEGYRMGSFTVEATPLGAMSEAPPAPGPAAAPAPAAPAPVPAPAQAPAAPAALRPAPAPAAHTGEDPAAVRTRVYEEELAKGSDPRVAEARAKSAEIKARRAAAAAPAAAPAAPAAAPAAPAPAPAPAPQAAPPSSPPPAAAEAPPGGGGLSAEEAAVVRTMIFEEATTKGASEEVAEALARAAEIRARRGPWWRPDW